VFAWSPEKLPAKDTLSGKSVKVEFLVVADESVDDVDNFCVNASSECLNDHLAVFFGNE